MQCPHCHTESPEGARFCLHCGERLVEVCPHCDTSLPLDARFCLQCGGKIAVAETVQLGGSEAMTQAIQRLIPQGFAERLLATRGQVSHERRLVTILFSDVTGSTAMVVVEVGSDLRVEYTAMGDAVNLAARMEQAAPPGGILISHDTYRHVRGVFDVLPQEPLAVKGKSEPVLTYLAQSVKPRAFRVEMRGVEGIETRMVGRDAELLILQNNYLDALDEAETHVVTVVGEAGVGKTRLLEEFFNWAELRPVTFYYFKGRAASTTQAVPYQLWRDLFAYRFQILDSDSAAKATSGFREGMARVLEPEKADLVGFDFGAAGSEAVLALLGSPNFGQLALANLCMVSIALGQDGAAWEYPRRALREHLAMQFAPHTLNDLVRVAHLQARAAQAERAAELLGLALQHPASYSEVQRDAQPVLALLREALGPEQLEAALARGAELDLEQVVAELLRSE